LKIVREHYPHENICILWLGSSVGNLSASAAVQFFRDAVAAVGTHCQILLCADMWKDRERLRAAYYDKVGVTGLFIKNGMRNALALLGHEVSTKDEESWVYEVDINEHLHQVEMYLKFPTDLKLPQHQVHIRAGERVLVEVSRKFTVGDFNHLANESGFVIDMAWRDQTWGMQMLIPFKEAYIRCWHATDAFFRNLPDWSMKPIDVRHPFCFYYGHLPAFAKLKLLPNEVPTKFDVMFSRGIDPIVTDPSKCHGHPEVPVQWPKREEIIEYVQHVREELMEAMDDALISARLINLALEHEYMHLETLAYMLVQERKKLFEKKSSNNCFNALPHHMFNGNNNNNSHVGINSGTTTKKKLSAAAEKLSIYSSGNNMVRISNGNAMMDGNVAAEFHMVQISNGNVMMGGNVADNGFMWDNEYPQFTTHVSEKFLVSSEPVSVRDFLAFVKEGGYEKEEFWQPVDFKFFKDQGHKHPATWSKVHGEYYVHSVDSTDHWSKVADQPVFVSLSEAEAFCHSVGCRIMTESEYHQILQSGYATKVHKLRSDGWEWTSSVFQPFPGFKPMVEYPEYSSDFFNSSHYVLKGASPLTHPKMWRDSFRNFYQRQYPFVFAKFRCCKNM
jgi:formylglycine-generating enzyme required for sulfatase activity